MLKVVFVGVGWIAQKVHIPFFRALPEARIVGIFDSNEARARDVGGALGVPVYPDLASVEDSDASMVLVSSYPEAHSLQVRALLRKGKHIICEKPLALSATEASELLASASRGRLFCCMTNRFREDVSELRNLIRGGVLGEPRYVRSTWHRAQGAPRSPGTLRSGVLWDLGIHLADLVRWITDWNEPAAVSAASLKPLPVRTASWHGCSDVHDGAPALAHDRQVHSAVALLKYGSGRAASIEASWASQVEADLTEISVEGSAGSARIRTVFGWSLDRNSVAEPSLTVRPSGSEREVVVCGQQRQQIEFEAQLRHFLEQIRNGKQNSEELRVATLAVGDIESAMTSLQVGHD